MTEKQAKEMLSEKIEALRSIDIACNLMVWDEDVSGVPLKSLSIREEAINWLETKAYKYLVSNNTSEIIDTLEAHSNTTNDYEKALLRDLKRQYRKATAIPIIDMQNYKKLCARAVTVRREALSSNNYASILPLYKEIFDYNRRFCDMYGYEHHPYDALLDKYESGTNIELYDTLFHKLSCKLTPLINRFDVLSSKYDENGQDFDISKQKEVASWLMNLLGYDLSCGKVAEVEHPFCMAVSRHDIRIGIKYYVNNVLTSISTILHEVGHALYEQNICDDLEQYALAGAPSAGIHESQAWLFENLIGKSRAFVKIIYPILKHNFSYFNTFDEDDLFREINRKNLTSVRILADELTYYMHIAIRYKFEKTLIENIVTASELPDLWAQLYESTFGKPLKNPAGNLLQDPHWCEGQVGIFPSYIIGAVYSSQFMHSMEKVIDVESAVEHSDFSQINKWLKENIHCHGTFYTPNELIQCATGESINPDFYIDYLFSKYSELLLMK